MWQYWLTVWWAKVAYGLLSAPFFVVVAVGGCTGLTAAPATGYDASGALALKLSPALAKKKYAMDVRAARLVGTAAGAGKCWGVLPESLFGQTVGEAAHEANEAAARVQAAVLGKRAQRARASVGSFPVTPVGKKDAPAVAASEEV